MMEVETIQRAIRAITFLDSRGYTGPQDLFRRDDAEAIQTLIDWADGILAAETEEGEEK